VRLKKGSVLTCDGVEYVLKESIGNGGSGTVWLAEASHQQWAIKILADDADDEKAERFNREAEFQKANCHPNIVPVVSLGDAGGRRFSDHKGQP
jgi:serine/threonine protein kinase